MPPNNSRAAMVKKVLEDAKKQNLDSDTLSLILADLTGPGAQPEELSPYQQILMEGALRDVRSNGNGKKGDSKKGKRSLGAGGSYGTKGGANVESQRFRDLVTFLERHDQGTPENRKGRKGIPEDPALGLAHPFSGPALDLPRSSAAAQSTRVRPRDTPEQTDPKAEFLNRIAQLSAQGGGSAPSPEPSAALTQIQTSDPQRDTSVRGSTDLPGALAALAQSVSGKATDPGTKTGKDQRDAKAAEDAGGPGTVEKLLPFLGLASLIGAAVAQHNEGPRTSGTTTQQLPGGGRAFTTIQDSSLRASDILGAGAQGALGVSQALGEGRQAEEEAQQAQAQEMIALEMDMRDQRSKTAGLLLRAGLKEPAMAMIVADNPELEGIDLSKMTEDEATEQNLSALREAMKPSVYSRLAPEFQEDLMRKFWSAHGWSIPPGGSLVAKENPNRAAISTITLKMMQMGVMPSPETLSALSIPEEQARAFVGAAKAANTREERQDKFNDMAKLTRMLESMMLIAEEDEEAMALIRETASSLAPSMKELSASLGQTRSVPADAVQSDVVNEPIESMSVDEAIDYIREFRNESRSQHEHVLRSLGVDLSDQRILNELDALPED